MFSKRAAPILLLLMILIFSGCYTLLSHPGEEEGFVEENHGTDCLSCHPDYHDDYGYSHYYYPEYWSDNDRWGHYYAVPWWWDYYWYNDDDYYYEDDNSNPRSAGGEKAARPASRFEGTGNTDFQTGAARMGGGSTGSSSSSSSGSASSKTKSSTEPKSSDIKQKSDSSEKKEKKPSRRSGRWKSQ